MALEKVKPGSWQGPIESGFGWHLVFVDTVIPGRIPAFEEVESEVKTAWLGEQKAASVAKGLPDDAGQVHGPSASSSRQADCQRATTSSQKRDSHYLRRRAMTGLQKWIGKENSKFETSSNV